MTSAHGAWPPRQLDGMSIGSAALWAAAALVALSAHAGAAWWLMRKPPEPPVQVAGAASIVVDIAALGTAPADQVSSGDPLKPVEPVENEAVEPVADAVQPAQAEPVQQPHQPVQAKTVSPPTETAPAPPVEPSPPSDVQIAAVPPVEQETAPVEVQPVDEADEVTLPEKVPLPTPRPEPLVTEREPEPKRPEPKKAEQPREKPEQTAKKAAARKPQRAGNGGHNEADARKGESDGAERATASARNAPGRGREAGNAAVSNYPGKVVSKLRRALRYPAQARRERLRGEVHVAFTVVGGGGVSGIRVVRSSGFPVLDQAALETVRRAAPFPPIPDGRPNWSFTVPLAFTR